MADVSFSKHFPEKLFGVTYAKQQIKLNRAKCLICNDVIVSAHIHDFVSCKCGNLIVDGGNDYIRRCFEKYNSWEELSDYEAEVPSEYEEEE